MWKLILDGLRRPILTEAAPAPDPAALGELAARLDRAAHRRLGRSLAIRQVDAGSCNGCELEIHALGNVLYDLERFGLRDALLRTHTATPDPKYVVALGDCAADGGCFAGSAMIAGGVGAVLPVDLHIPGCPPTPLAILAGLLALVEQEGG